MRKLVAYRIPVVLLQQIKVRSQRLGKRKENHYVIELLRKGLAQERSSGTMQ